MIGTDRLAHASRWRNRPLAEKALLSLGLLALALALPPWPGAALVLAVAVAAAMRSGAPVAGLLALAAAPAAFIATGAATLMIQIGADGISLAADHGRAAGALALRSLAAVASLLLLAVTTPATDLVQALRRLGLPADVAEVTLLTYRFLFVLQETAFSIHASQEARLGTVGWRRRIRSAGLLAAALLPRAMDRARRMEAGLAARGFDGSLRTLSPRHPPTLAGLAVAALPLAAIGCISLWT